MPPSPTLVILRGVCDVGVTSPSLLLSLDSLRLGLRGRRRRRFSDPDDSRELLREDGVGVGTRPRWNTISSWSFISPHWDRLSCGTIVARIFPRSIGPRALASIASFHTHTAEVAQACRNFTLGLFALPPPHSTLACTVHWARGEREIKR